LFCVTIESNYAEVFVGGYVIFTLFNLQISLFIVERSFLFVAFYYWHITCACFNNSKEPLLCLSRAEHRVKYCAKLCDHNVSVFKMLYQVLITINVLTLQYFKYSMCLYSSWSVSGALVEHAAVVLWFTVMIILGAFHVMNTC
jgi:hypothetical protein